MTEPLELLRKTAQSLLCDGELAKKWHDMNAEDKSEN